MESNRIHVYVSGRRVYINFTLFYLNLERDHSILKWNTQLNNRWKIQRLFVSLFFKPLLFKNYLIRIKV